MHFKILAVFAFTYIYIYIYAKLLTCIVYIYIDTYRIHIIYIYIYMYIYIYVYIYTKYNKKMIFMKQSVRDIFEQKVFCKFLKITMKGFNFNKVPGF